MNKTFRAHINYFALLFKFAVKLKKQNMKQLLFTLLFCLPLFVFAKNDDSKYLAGAVPEVNGQVLFQQTFAVKDKSKDEIYQVMNAFVKRMTQEENQLKIRLQELSPRALRNGLSSRKKFCIWTVHVSTIC